MAAVKKTRYLYWSFSLLSKKFPIELDSFLCLLTQESRGFEKKDEEEDRESNNQEVENRIEKDPVIDSRGPR